MAKHFRTQSNPAAFRRKERLAADLLATRFGYRHFANIYGLDMTLKKGAMMDELSTSRRSAVVGIVATVAALQTGGSLARAQDAASSTASAPITTQSEDMTRWGTDGTRDLLSSKLDAFFGGATGSYTVVRDQDKNNLQPNGEYLLADQIRLPLYGVAAPKIVASDGSTIYSAFVYGNPYVETFIKIGPTGAIEGVALADSQDITKNGTVVDIEPRLTIFYRQNSAPADLRAEAEKEMNIFYSRVPPAPTMHDHTIKVIEHKLG